MRKIIMTAAAAAMAIGIGAPAAKAEPWSHGHGYYRDGGHGWRGGHHRRGFDGGDALAAGAIGLAAGALLGSALAAPPPPPPPVYYEPYERPAYRAPVYVAPPVYEDTVPARRPYRAARYYDDYGTSSRDGHVEACFSRYQSYDPRTDTFLGYDGYRHRCNL